MTKPEPEQKTEDMAGDKVSAGWIRKNLRTVPPFKWRPKDKYDAMAAKLARKAKP